MVGKLVNTTLESALADAHDRYASKRPKSAALRKKALKVLPGGNTRTVLSYQPFPTAMKKGQDRRLWDLDGHEYLDLCGEYTAGLFGHSDPTIQKALKAALKNGVSLAAVGETETKLAALLCSRFPSIELIRFANSGTEANLMAITVARAFTGKSKIISFRGGYHGSVLTFTSANPMEVTAPFPFILLNYNDSEAAIAAIEEHRHDLAAVILEPMIGGGGGIPATTQFLQDLRAATTNVGALLIFDEVMTSRMSGGGLQARTGVTPDLTALGKYIGGGMSFGAFGGRADIMNLFAKRLPHAGTFNNNVMTMAAGYAGMSKIFTPDVADAFYERGERLRERLNSACREARLPMQFTGLGTLITAHFRDGQLRAPYMPTAYEEGLRELFFFDMLDKGIYMARRAQVALSLPVTEADTDRLVEAVEDFLSVRAALLQVEAKAAA